MAASADNILSGSLGLTSDYVWRGISLSNSNPALQGGVDANFSNGSYAGVWGSLIEDFGTGASIELDVYGGHVFTLNEKTSIDVGAIYYGFPGGNSSADLDMVEVYAGVDHTFNDTFSAGTKLSYSPDFAIFGEDATYFEVNGNANVNENISVGAHYGMSNFDVAGIDYDDWGVNATYTFTKNINATIGYTDTDINNAGPLADDRWMLSTQVNF